MIEIELTANETVLYTSRVHWFIFFTRCLLVAVLALAPLALFVFMPQALLPYLEKAVAIAGGAGALFSFLYSLWLLLLWVILAVFWTDYYLDVWYVTNERVIAVDQRGLFHRRLGSCRHEMIQDVTVEVPGLIATLLHFGTIRVATAGPEKAFVFRNAASPNELKARIMAEQRSVQERRQAVNVSQ